MDQWGLDGLGSVGAGGSTANGGGGKYMKICQRSKVCFV